MAIKLRTHHVPSNFVFLHEESTAVTGVVRYNFRDADTEKDCYVAIDFNPELEAPRAAFGTFSTGSGPSNKLVDIVLAQIAQG